MQYVIQQVGDENKVAIYGGSHGGYAVLRGLTKTQIYMLVLIMSVFQTYLLSWKQYHLIGQYLSILKPFGTIRSCRRKTVMEEISTIFHIDKISKPLFVVQGANDPRVNIEKVIRLLRRCEVELMSLHGKI